MGKMPTLLLHARGRSSAFVDAPGCCLLLRPTQRGKDPSLAVAAPPFACFLSLPRTLKKEQRFSKACGLKRAGQGAGMVLQRLQEWRVRGWIKKMRMKLHHYKGQPRIGCGQKRAAELI